MVAIPSPDTAARFYRTWDTRHDLTPRHPFLYYVHFRLHDADVPDRRYARPGFGLFVRQVTRPRIDIDVEIRHQYNRKRAVLKSWSPGDLTMTAYDTVDGAFLLFIYNVLQWEVSDFSRSEPAWSATVDPLVSEPDRIAFWGVRSGAAWSPGFVRTIRLYELGAGYYNRWTFWFPVLRSVDFGQFDYTNDVGQIEIQTTWVYEGVTLDVLAEPHPPTGVEDVDGFIDDNSATLCHAAYPNRSYAPASSATPPNRGIPLQPAGGFFGALSSLGRILPSTFEQLADFGSGIVGALIEPGAPRGSVSITVSEGVSGNARNAGGIIGAVDAAVDLVQRTVDIVGSVESRIAGNASGRPRPTGDEGGLPVPSGPLIPTSLPLPDPTDVAEIARRVRSALDAVIDRNRAIGGEDAANNVRSATRVLDEIARELAYGTVRRRRDGIRRGSASSATNAVMVPGSSPILPQIGGVIQTAVRRAGDLVRAVESRDPVAVLDAVLGAADDGGSHLPPPANAANPSYPAGETARDLIRRLRDAASAVRRMTTGTNPSRAAAELVDVAARGLPPSIRPWLSGKALKIPTASEQMAAWFAGKLDPAVTSMLSAIRDYLPDEVARWVPRGRNAPVGAVPNELRPVVALLETGVEVARKIGESDAAGVLDAAKSMAMRLASIFRQRPAFRPQRSESQIEAPRTAPPANPPAQPPAGWTPVPPGGNAYDPMDGGLWI